MKEVINAIDITSPSDARKLGLFVDRDGNLLTWVNWGTRSNSDKKVRPYFRHYPKGRIPSNKYQTIEDENQERLNFCNQSDLHKTANTKMRLFLEKCLKENIPIHWSYYDRRVSDFELSGNLLSEVIDIKERYRFKTPFDMEYEFDIALLGKTITKKPILLGAIELEKENRFGILKCLICKSLGFPLVSIPLTGLSTNDINEDWCYKSLIENKQVSDDGLRRNYIYIHNLLYPVYLNVPSEIRGDTKHQYLIFVKNRHFDKILNWLKDYKKNLGFKDDKIITIQPTILKHDEQKSMFANEGSIAGLNWKDFNDSKYIRVSLNVPYEKMGRLYIYHLIMTRILNYGFDTLVGYKYAKGLFNKFPEQPIWISSLNSKDFKVLPKCLSEPIEPIIDYLSRFGLYKSN